MKNKIRSFLEAFALVTVICGLPVAHAATVQVTGPVANSVTWYSTNEYVLNGQVYVLSNAVLNIEPGTVVRGKPGDTNNYSALFITRGARIFAEGTRTKPIIFTAEADDLNDPEDLLITDAAQWGGLVVLGQAVLNTAINLAGAGSNPKYDLYEGLSDITVSGQNVHRYGGNNDGDSSGVLRYVSIRHGGTAISQDKEINGVSLACVGSNTVIEHVEVIANADDGFEFFGGTVNTKYLVSAFNQDEQFDIDQGYRGQNQFWFGIHNPGITEFGGEWNGEPNTFAVSNTPLATFEIYNMTLIGGGTSGRALRVRDYAAPRVRNAIWTGFPTQGARVDNPGAVFFTNGTIVFEETIWNNVGASAAVFSNYVFEATASSNVFANPLLHGISWTNNNGLDPRPQAGSPALGSSITAPVNGFYKPVSYKGAFDNNDLWLRRWTALDAYGFLPARTNVIQVAGPIANTVTWFSTNEYILNGQIYVLSNAVLNIEAGTVVRGKPGDTNNYSALFITRGAARIFANGTANNPIIFTAEADDLNDPEDLLITDAAQWGGLVVLGQAVLNTAINLAGAGSNPKYDLYEGLSDITVSGQNVHRYGGNNDGDSSGVLRYVSIRHGGTAISQDKEINGVSLACVGSNTVIEYVEVIANADDGFEFFGGTVNSKYLVSAFNQDEQFDIDQGYRGQNQFWFGIHNPGITEFGGEWNGEPNTFAVSNTPLATFEIYNMTLIGGGTSGRALRVRDYAAPRVRNAIWTGFPTQGARVDNPGAVFFTNGTIVFAETIWNNVGASAAVFSNYVFEVTASSNVFANPLLHGISWSNNNGLDPRPQAGSPALGSSVAAPANGHYEPQSYKGAFDGQLNWAVQWTGLGEYSIMSSKGGAEKIPQPSGTAVPPTPPTLALNPAGGSIQIVYASQSGFNYQLQSSTTLSFWSNEGSAQPGNGGPLTNTVPTTGDQQFFRVLSQ